MTNLKPYPSYKDSGVEWIGEMPKDWSLIKLKYLCSINTGDRDTQDSEKGGKYPFFVRSDNINSINTFTYDGEAVMTAGDGVGVGRVFHYYKGKFSAHQRVYLFTDFKNLIGKYLYYYLKSNLIFEVKQGTAKSTVDSLRRQMLTDFPIIIPEKRQQKGIVDFIDYRTSEIDNLITNKQLLIKLLEEKRQSIITETVTKGLDPNVKMKDSGIEWIGEIPEHWEIGKLKYLAEITMGQSPDSNSITDLEKGIPFLQGNAEFTDKYPVARYYSTNSKKNSKINDVLLSVRAPVGAMNWSDKVYSIGRGLCSITMKKEYNRHYFWYALSVGKQKLYSKVTGSTFESVNLQDIKELPFPIPERKEQNNITRYLINIEKKLNLIKKLTLKQIVKLKEYRDSLIYEAVTGKIDLRNFGENSSDYNTYEQVAESAASYEK